MSRVICFVVSACLFGFAPTLRAAEAPNCEFVVDGYVRTLVIGSTYQELELVSDDQCIGLLAAKTQVTLLAKEPVAAQLRATVESREEKVVRLSFHSIPTHVLPGLYTWEVQASTKKLGTVVVDASVIKTRPELDVTYPASELNERHTGKSALTSDKEAIAVVTPGRTTRGPIVNTANIILPQGLPVGSHDIFWAIERSSWGTHVLFKDCLSEEEAPLRGIITAPPADEAVLARKEISQESHGYCSIMNGDRIEFSVNSLRPAPLIVSLQLLQPKEVERKVVHRVVLSYSLQLAAAARIESLPLPISEALYVQCSAEEMRTREIFTEQLKRENAADANERGIWNNATRAIDDDAVRNGECAIAFRGDRLSEVGRNLLGYFGPQIIVVDVRRETGNASTRVQWPFSPNNGGVMALTLPLPEGNENGSGLYIVEAKIETQGANTNYRQGSVAGGASTLPLQDPGFKFTARLRPRGPFGWRRGIRTFVTIPVSLTGLRFPAPERDLESSSDSLAFRAVNLRAGILGAIEPWNYDAGENPWPIPLRFVGGFNLFDVTEADFTPSLLAGVTAAVPVVEAPTQLGTSVALGVYWEVDLRERYPFKNGNYLLVTFGFNVFSLFAAK